MNTRFIKIRSVHVDGPQPGHVAEVLCIVEAEKNGQWLDCYLARFGNGELWYCPVMAIKDYERVKV